MNNKKYEVFIDDNFHYMDDDERVHYGDHDSLEKAVAICKQITEDSQSYYRPGIPESDLIAQYVLFGDDPCILGARGVPFSARTYAIKRAKKLTNN